MAVMLNADIDSSFQSVEFYERYKEAFGKVISAEMICVIKPINKYKVTLINVKGEKLLFDTGLSLGCISEGSRATQRVLELAGFPIDDEFIKTNTSFKLTR